MYRGSTPTIKLNIKSDVDFNQIDALEFTLNSNSNMKVATKNDVDIDVENKTISLALTQEDTLSFNVGIIEIQLRVKFNNGNAWVSPIKKTTMERIIKGGVL